MSQGLQRTYAIFNFVPRQQLCFVFLWRPNVSTGQGAQRTQTSTWGPNQKILFLWGPHVNTEQDMHPQKSSTLCPTIFFVGPKIEYFRSDVQGMFQIFALEPNKYVIFL